MLSILNAQGSSISHMSWKRNVSRVISEMFALSRRLTGIRYGFRVFMYHSVNCRMRDRSHDPVGIFTVHPRDFNTHVKSLVENPYHKIVSFRDGVGPADAQGLRIAVTFDDGYKDNVHTVAPILVGLGIPFTVFVTSGFMKDGRPDILSLAELRELADLPGVEIGSHGETHTPFTKLDDFALANELTSSKKYLEDVTGRDVVAVSYPHGAVDVRVRYAVKNAGYEIGGCSRLDVNDNFCDPLALFRTVILARDSQRVFLQKLYGDWDWYRWRDRKPDFKQFNGN